MSEQREQAQIEDQKFMGKRGEQPWSVVALQESEPNLGAHRLYEGQGASIEVQNPPESLGNLPQDFEARDNVETPSMVTNSVSSVTSKDRSNFIWCVMVKPGGLDEFLGYALMDTGSMVSFVCEQVARQAMKWGLTKLEPYDSEPPEGIVKGAKPKVLGKMRLKFFIEDVAYRHSFLVIEEDDRFDMLLGDKFIAKTRLLQGKTADCSGGCL
jgi:hypothetical protein